MLKYKIYPELDFASENKIKNFQWEQIKLSLNYANKFSPFYKKLFLKHKITPEKIKTYKDFLQIPLTTKDDLRKYNFQFFAVDKNKWVDCFSTGGTTGTPVYFPITKNDLSRTAFAEYRCLTIAGIKEQHIVQFNMPMSTALWGAGLSYYLGYQLIGSCVLRFGPSSAEAQIKTMTELGATVLHSNVGFSIKLAQTAEELNLKNKLKVKLILAGLENILQPDLKRNSLGKTLQNYWKKARVCAVYGNTESAAPINECQYQQGYHLTPEFTFIEILNPHSFQPVEVGEKGVMVITNFGVEGMPLIRYCLGDISFLISGKCKCGRTAPRLGAVEGRIDEQVKIKGVNIYPSSLENILKINKNINDYFIEVEKGKDFTDNLILNLNISESASESEISVKLRQTVREKFNLTPQINFCPLEEIRKKITAASINKPKRFVDKR